MLGGTEASADEAQCAVESASLNYGVLASLRFGWQTGVGEVVVRCHNASPAARTFTITVALSHDDPLENTVEPRAPALKVRFFEDPGYRIRWGGDGPRREGKAVGLTVESMSEGVVRVPVYGMVFAPRNVTAGEYRSSVGVQIRYSD